MLAMMVLGNLNPVKVAVVTSIFYKGVVGVRNVSCMSFNHAVSITHGTAEFSIVVYSQIKFIAYDIKETLLCR